MSYLAWLPSDIYEHIFMLISYEDIINVCREGTINICNKKHLSLWWKKVNYEIDESGLYFFDLYKLLEDSLDLKQWFYFEAAMKHYKENDERIWDLFSRYGYAINKINIIKKCSKLIGNQSDMSNLHQEKYYLFKDFYQAVYKALRGRYLHELRVLSSSKYSLPIRYHSDKYLFNKLIIRYMGIDAKFKARKTDVEKFELLINIYTNTVASQRDLYELIGTTYYTHTINTHIQLMIYGEKNKYLRMWIDDNLKMFKIHKDKIYKVLLGNIKRSCEGIIRITNMVYKNGKIINYLIKTKQYSILSLLNLYKHQFQSMVNTMTQDDFDSFIHPYFFVSEKYYHPENFPHKREYIRKTNYLLNHIYFEHRHTQLMIQYLSHYPRFLYEVIQIFKHDKIKNYLYTKHIGIELPEYKKVYFERT